MEEEEKEKEKDIPTCQLLPINPKQVLKWNGKGRKEKGDGGRENGKEQDVIEVCIACCE